MLEQALALLEAGRTRIAQGWCQGALARNARGHSVNPDAPEAASWCAGGALGPPASRVRDAAIIALRVHTRGAVSTWNDALDRTHAEVLALYDAAIADLRAKIEKAP